MSVSASNGLPDEAAQAMDRRVQDLKAETLGLMRDLAVSERQIRCPEHSCTTIYATVNVSGFLLDEIEIQVNQQRPVRKAYSGSESRAMLKLDGYHRVLQTNLDPGSHTLRTTFIGHFADAEVGDPPITGTIEQIIHKGYDELHVLQRVDRGGRRRSARLDPPLILRSNSAYAPAERQAAQNGVIARFDVASASDPRVHVARYLFNDERYLSALVELEAVLAETDNGVSPSESVNWLYGDALLNFGLYDQAETVYRRTAQASNDARRIAEAELNLARFAIERGRLVEAEQVLGRSRGRLPPVALGAWRELSARMLLAQGRYNEAVEILDALDDSDDRTAFSRYNLAIALLNDGRESQGRETLDGVGRMAVYNDTELALRDKANVVLGYHFLRQEQGGTAKPLFQRVRVEGPHSNRALLGLGWAEIAPRGERQKRVSTADEETGRTPYSSFSNLGVLIRPGYFDANVLARLGLGSFKLDQERSDEEEALMRALVPWSELAKRDRFEHAVQEGRMAIPYALNKLGAHQQALQHYLQAVRDFEAARNSMDEGLEAIPGGRMIETMVRGDIDSEAGWRWDVRSLADVPETYWLSDLLAEHRFQEQLKNYRDLRLLARRLDAWQVQAQAVPLQAMQSRGAWPLEMTLSRLRSRYEPIAGEPLQLQMEDYLGDAWLSAGNLRLTGPGPIRLQLAGPPARFNGPIEQLSRLAPRIESLRPLIADAGADQRAALDALASTAIKRQKTELERYLLEARFAVARIYDSQLRGNQE